MRDYLILVKPPKSPKIGGLLEFYSPQNWGVRGAKSYPESATPYLEKDLNPSRGEWPFAPTS
ncbi:hypothetical protein D5R40_26470 [Okeania hirsuta]|uniref:Uncharacterized protein n=1 Tax=Okeania hirsuta TaxID=1458930 RepID=A0A3N6P5A7_9CYAN|nr:hypothetical protein D5R40_26470 [Okeania hirsuta]